MTTNVLILSAEQGLSVQSVGAQLGIDMSNPPESYAFEMQIFPTP